MKPWVIPTPIYKEKIWGGTKLKSFRSHVSSSQVGESWELSDFEGEFSVLEDGKTFREFWSANPAQILGQRFRDAKRFPLLVKIIDAKEKLSVQVHPDDAYALRYDPASQGKKECWYVLDHEQNAEIVVGFAKDISKEEYAKLIEQNQAETPLRTWKVSNEECFLILPGTIHAIGGGNLLLEVQQNSDSTYRVYDYGRLGDDGKPRALHLQKSLDVLDFSKSTGKEKQSPTPLEPIPLLGAKNLSEQASRSLLVTTDHFRLEKITWASLQIPTGLELPTLPSNPNCFRILFSLTELELVCGLHTVSIPKFQTVFFPAYTTELGFEKIVVRSHGDESGFILVGSPL